MNTATYYVGDVLDVLATIEPGSVDLVLTSPPFLALRSYLPADHPDKAKEGGQEKTPGEFIDWLLDVVEACDRVLAPHGSMCFELGDTYAGSGGAGGDYDEGGLRDGQPKFKQGSPKWRGYDGRGPRDTTSIDQANVGIMPANGGIGWPADKSLTLVPETFRFALAYGRNPHTGRKTKPWRVRNVIRWVRPNPPVGALGDKFRPATSEMVVFCRTGEAGRKRYFDLDAVREPHKRDPALYTGNGYSKGNPEGVPGKEAMPGNPAGAPPLDWWEIPTYPYPGAHYATWPPDLCVKPIKAMTPEKVCETCGEASRRITERTEEYAAARAAIGDFNQRDGTGQGVSGSRSVLVKAAGKDITSAENVTVGWTDCGHDTWRPGTVLDPFAGSGTTLAVAVGHGRNAIGIDLDERNVELARDRVGPLFFQEVADVL